MKGAMKRICSVCLAASVLATAAAIPGMAAKTTTYEPLEFDYNRSAAYVNYQEANKDVPLGTAEQVIPAAEYAAAEEGKVTVSSYKGEENVLAFTEDPAWVEFVVEVPQTARYNLAYTFCASEDSKNDVQFSVQINGESPFSESENIKAYRGWKNNPAKMNADGTFLRDSKGNDLRPTQILNVSWTEELVKDPSGLVGEPFQYVLQQGANTIRIETEGVAFYLKELKLTQQKEVPAYDAVLSTYEANGYQKAAAGVSVVVQGEDAFSKSSTTLYPAEVKNNVLMEPSHPSQIRLNSIGGTNWADNGQWIKWNVDVPEDGLYQIAVKYRQNANAGSFSTRKLYIDGEIPFKEFSNIRFAYDSQFQQKVLADEENNPYFVYLTAGTHELKMEVTLGDMSTIINTLNDVVYDLNDIYRRIIMISGVTPDSLRDYDFPNRVQGFNEIFLSCATTMREQAKALVQVTGSEGSQTATLQEFARQLESIVEKPSTMNNRLESMKNNIVTLSDWIISAQSQPMDIDYITVCGEGTELPATTPNFLQSLGFGTRGFFASFVSDYSTVSGDGMDTTRSIKVWNGTGRDQMSIINSMITDLFTPETGISVQLELVQGSLIEATLAGRGPDIAMMQAADIPVNYAIRNALVDISQFEGFEEVKASFNPAALTPYEWRGGYYALPEMQNFTMMFYRQDVLAQLGLGIPETWDDFFAMLPVLNRNNLLVGIGDQQLFQILLYQNGGQYYKDDKKSTGFDSDIANEAFEKTVDCFVKYDFPLTYDFFNRFKTGEMPISIQLYTEFNRLSVAAPEINGLWDMAPVPGTVQADGTVDHTEISGVSGMVMFKGTEDKEAAWEFMKWYTGPEAQARYGTELESLLGAAGRYATANLEAFEELSWTSTQKAKLKEQWNQLAGVPELPGSYYTTRCLTNAFKSAILLDSNPYSVLYEWNKDLNDEIARKYEEFGLE